MNNHHSTGTKCKNPTETDLHSFFDTIDHHWFITYYRPSFLSHIDQQTSSLCWSSTYYIILHMCNVAICLCDRYVFVKWFFVASGLSWSPLVLSSQPIYHEVETLVRSFLVHQLSLVPWSIVFRKLYQGRCYVAVSSHHQRSEAPRCTFAYKQYYTDDEILYPVGGQPVRPPPPPPPPRLFRNRVRRSRWWSWHD